jgi:hypothetical protein
VDVTYFVDNFNAEEGAAVTVKGKRVTHWFPPVIKVDSSVAWLSMNERLLSRWYDLEKVACHLIPHLIPAQQDCLLS